MTLELPSAGGFVSSPEVFSATSGLSSENASQHVTTSVGLNVFANTTIIAAMHSSSSTDDDNMTNNPKSHTNPAAFLSSNPKTLYLAFSTSGADTDLNAASSVGSTNSMMVTTSAATPLTEGDSTISNITSQTNTLKFLSSISASSYLAISASGADTEAKDSTSVFSAITTSSAATPFSSLMEGNITANLTSLADSHSSNITDDIKTTTVTSPATVASDSVSKNPTNSYLTFSTTRADNAKATTPFLSTIATMVTTSAAMPLTSSAEDDRRTTNRTINTNATAFLSSDTNTKVFLSPRQTNINSGAPQSTPFAIANSWAVSGSSGPSVNGSGTSLGMTAAVIANLTSTGMSSTEESAARNYSLNQGAVSTATQGYTALASSWALFGAETTATNETSNISSTISSIIANLSEVSGVSSVRLAEQFTIISSPAFIPEMTSSVFPVNQSTKVFNFFETSSSFLPSTATLKRTSTSSSLLALRTNSTMSSRGGKFLY